MQNAVHVRCIDWFWITALKVKYCLVIVLFDVFYIFPKTQNIYRVCFSPQCTKHLSRLMTKKFRFRLSFVGN